MSHLPPAYNEPHENVPSYASASAISARWHIINTPAKGIFGSRGLSLVSDQAAIITPGVRSAVPGYDLIVIDNLTIEIHPKAASTGSESSDKAWKTPVIAKINFSPNDPAKANISFAYSDKAAIIVDSHDLRKGVSAIGDTNRNDLRLVTLYEPVGGILPVAWSVEDNKNVPVDTVREKTPEPDDSHSGSKKSANKWSWKSMTKDLIPQDHNRSRSRSRSRSRDAGDEAKTQQQRKGLSSNFRLIDSSSTAYVTFANEFFKDPSMATKIPPYEKEIKNHKSWGHLDIHDPQLTAIRSSYPAFEKWNETDLELVVLLTLVIILENNLKINGGAARGSVFGDHVFGAQSGYGTWNEGKSMAMSFGMGGMVNGIAALGNS